jgi:phosphomannomutase
LNLVLQTVDVDRIRQCKFKVVLDSNHGAGVVLGRELLEHLNCDWRIFGETPDGNYEHEPEPTAENLRVTLDRLAPLTVDVAFCQDPDADRLAIIDETHRYIGEEYTLAITLDHALRRLHGPVVVNCSTSRMSADIARRHGVEFTLSAVGEANVSQAMIETKAVYGGEGNGGPIDPRVGYVRDSFVAIAQILDAMAITNQTISQLVANIPRYEIYKTKINVDRSGVTEMLDRLEKQFPNAAVSRLDGLRLDWPGQWLLVRPSNTEPIVRAIAEAKTLEAAKQLCAAAAQAVTR